MISVISMEMCVLRQVGRNVIQMDSLAWQQFHIYLSAQHPRKGRLCLAVQSTACACLWLTT